MKIILKDTFITSVRAVLFNFRFVFLLWGANFAASFIVSMPIYYMITDHLSNSAIGSIVSEEFTINWLMQFKYLYQNNLGEIPLVLISTLGAYLLIQSFFSGGIIAVFNLPEKNHSVDFFYGCVKYWYRFTKIMLISLFFFALAFKLNDLLGDLISYIFLNSESELADFILRSLRYILLIFLIGIVTIISDYSKVSIALSDKDKILKEMGNAAVFIKNNFSKAFTAFFIVAVIGALGSIVYNIIASTIPRSPYYYLIISFILQQMLIIFRFLVRMLFFATEVYLYKDFSADVVVIDNQ